MQYKTITKGNESFLIVQVSTKIFQAFISKTGKSLVYRINGTWLSYNGEIKGENGVISGYIHQRFNGERYKAKKGRHFSAGDIIEYDFGKGIGVRSAIMIPVQKIE